jgi:hypothetical protein
VAVSELLWLKHDRIDMPVTATKAKENTFYGGSCADPGFL